LKPPKKNNFKETNQMMSFDFSRPSGRRACVTLAAALVFGSVQLSLPAAAQDQVRTFPSHAVTMVVPYAPGGLSDSIGRIVAKRLGEKWKQPVIVENRPGGGTIIGT